MQQTEWFNRFKILLLMALILGSCSTLEQPSDGAAGGVDNADPGALSNEEAEELQQLLDQTRSTLTTAEEQTSTELEVPKVFTQEDSSNASANANPYQGYRVQLISTRSVQQADTIAAGFQKWIQQKMPQYPAKTYTFFQQPHYKVHVGDFQSRARAIQFNQIVKQKYPYAWIVPDRINPNRVPAERISFSVNDSLKAETSFN